MVGVLVGLAFCTGVLFFEFGSLDCDHMIKSSYFLARIFKKADLELDGRGVCF